MPDLKSLLSEIAKSKAANGGNYLRDGRYTLVLEHLSVETLFAGRTFIAELYVQEAANDPTAKDERGVQIEANPVGSSVTFLQQFDKHPMTAFKATKAFLLALADEKEEEVDEAEFVAYLELAIGKDQPLRGALVKAESYRKPTKDKSKMLVLPKWIAAGNTPEQIAARRKLLDNQAPKLQ
jgi:hypothetical protein